MGFLFDKHRFKVAYGGRDGGKSWSMARALLLLGAEKPLRVGCFREIQKDLDDSAYKLLKDQIYSLGLSDFYTVLRSEIRGKNQTEFVFSGLSNQTKDSIKSFEGIDVAWVEEAHSVSEGSWDILEPTIRKKDSEIWVSFNPSMDSDYTYRFFVTDPPAEAKVVNINWNDNPWRSEALDKARLRMQEKEPDKYLHVYGGQCRPAVDGAIYYKEVSELRSSGRFCNVPYDPMLKVHIACDLGFNDYMSLILFQRLSAEIRIIRYIEDRQRYIPSYSQELRDLKLNYGTMYLPHDGTAKHLSGASAQEQFQKLDWHVAIVPNMSVETGIRKAREVFPRVALDKSNAGELLNRLGRYRRHVKPDGQGTTPMHDDESHGADGFRYLALIADQATNDKANVFRKPIVYPKAGYV